MKNQKVELRRKKKRQPEYQHKKKGKKNLPSPKQKENLKGWVFREQSTKKM